MNRNLPDRWLTALLVPATVALMLAALTMTRHAYLGVSVRDARVATVEPGSPGWKAGLRAGDELKAAEPELNPDPLEPNPLERARPGQGMAVRRTRGGQEALVWLVPESPPEGERRYKAFLFAIASGFLLLGGWVWSERRDPLTRVFLLLCVAFAGMLAPPPWFETRGIQLAYELAYVAAVLFVPVLFMHFFALFPEPRPRKHAGAWVRAGYGLATAIAAATVAVVLESRFGAQRLKSVLPLLNAAELFLFAMCMSGGLVLFAHSFARVPGSDARRRLRVAFLGTLLGAAPFAVVTAWRNLAPGTPLPGERLAVAFTLSVPASFAWAIAVHRVFDFRVALRAVVVVLLSGVVAVATYFAGEWLASSWWPVLGEGVSGASLALLALAAALAGPARPWLGRLGERVVPIAGEMALAAWAPSDEAVRSGDPARLLAEACESVRQALRLSGCAALRVHDGPPRLIAQAGARLMPSLGDGFVETLSRVEGPCEIPDVGLPAADRDTLELAGVHWMLPVPGTPIPAVLLLGRRLTGAWLDRHEIRDLQQLGHHLAVSLENAQLRHEARSRVALDRELADAHRVQVRRLPRRTPVYPTLDCAAATLSTESVGGDYYDFIEMAPRDFTLAVGDAAGHGVPAALVLAGVQARFRGEAARARHPGDLLEALNRDLVAIDQPERFMGLLCARVDVAAGILRFANAGLTPPLVRRAGGRFEELTESGMLLGVSEAARYGVSSVELGAGDIAVVYTDGLTEASRAGQMFGVEGIQAVLDRQAHRRSADVLEELLGAVRNWADAPLDDLTIVVLKQLSAPRGRGSRPQTGLKASSTAADNSG